MRLTGLLAATAIVSMIAAPAFAASANPAAKLSLTNGAGNAAAAARLAGKPKSSMLLPGLAVAAVIVAAVAASHPDSKAASS